jgi:hypothetical protein
VVLLAASGTSSSQAVYATPVGILPRLNMQGAYWPAVDGDAVRYLVMLVIESVFQVDFGDLKN